MEDPTLTVCVVADTDWLPLVDDRLAGSVTRVGPGGGVGEADILVVPLECSGPLLDAHGGTLTASTVWVVPKSARQAELERLADAAPSCQFVFEENPDAVAEAVDALAEERQAEAGDVEEDPPDPDDPMQALWEQFHGTMFERLEVLEEAGSAILEGTLKEEQLAEAHGVAHKLHGSLGTFGLQRGSELASELEDLVEDALESGTMDPGARYRYSELVVFLRREIEGGRPAPGADGHKDRSPLPDPDAGTVLIVESEGDRLEKLKAAAAARGWRPVGVISAEGGLQQLDETPPDLVVLDPGSGDAETLEALLTRLASGRDPVPVIFQGRTRSLGERLKAVTLGARVFVDREASPEAIMGRAESLQDAETPGDARILAVDDDPAVLRVLTLLLRGAGFTVRTLRSPLEFWHALEAVGPDLLLLDVDMPGVNGLQLCRAVRADPRWEDLPILFLTARSGPSMVVAGFEAGADDFVVKPVAGPELVARVETRLARTVHDATDVNDPETGLPGRAAGRGSLETQLGIADRHGEVVTVALVRLVGDPQDGLDTAFAWLARRVGKDIRREDVVARWTRHELMVARYGEDGPETRRWLERRLPQGAGHVRVGTATYPEDGTAAALVDEAAARLEDARADTTVRSRPEEAARVDADIVVVEDDEALGTLLAQTLDERGYNTHWIRDGAEAAELLTGEKPSLRASLIVLDVGLPGMDGLTLLRRLARDGITRRTRVLMLTARSAESEVVNALELGAFDHVPKPFSVSELLHRVRRALGDKGAP